MDSSQNKNVFPSSPNSSNLPNSTGVLVLGIISIVGCFCYGIVGLICGIIALVLAKRDLALYRTGQYSESSYNNLKAGRVCAIIGTSLSAITLAFVLFVIISVGTSSLNDPRFWEQLQRR